MKKFLTKGLRSFFLVLLIGFINPSHITAQNIDCNGDVNGSAFVDGCGNCVGGNTGAVACITFTPTVSVALSNTDCDSLADLTISVSQDPNEPDMDLAVFSSATGSFDIANMSVGDFIGTAVLSANNGANTFNAQLTVTSVLSLSEVIVESEDINTGLVLGSFNILNTNPGVSISATTVPDGNNTTSGNSQVLTFSNVFVNPSSGPLVFTTTIASELGDLDVQTFSFTIICLSVDCNGDVNGSALVDGCGNCVGGNTGAVACIAFTPTVSVALSNTDCDSLADLTISVSQDPNEPDMDLAVFSSATGSFDIANMSVGDVIGTAVLSANNGANTFNTQLTVTSIVSSSEVIVESEDINTGLVLGSFNILNTNPGVSISAAPPIPDGNNTTSGNSQVLTFSNVFVNPSSGSLVFTTTIASELGDLDVQPFSFTITCLILDCNGDVNGSAFLDSCGNCVGGNTGAVACIAFTPTVLVALSNTDCDSLADLTISVSQDPNEPDMALAVFSSNTGSFDIANMSVGDVIGTAVLSANNGANTFNTQLTVTSIVSSSEVIVESEDINTGLVLGSFNILNTNPGVSISAAPPIPDGNNTTSGNSQVLTFSNVFVNPSSGSLVFTTTIDSELGDLDVQPFSFTINCNNLCLQVGDANCDGIVNLSDLN